MARQLRRHVPGGWCHITARGMGRRKIFKDDRDRKHFLELLEGMVERYGVVLHAYVLMDNHYRLVTAISNYCMMIKLNRCLTCSFSAVLSRQS